MAKYIGMKSCPEHGVPMIKIEGYERDIPGWEGEKPNRLCLHRENHQWHYFYYEDSEEKWKKRQAEAIIPLAEMDEPFDFKQASVGDDGE